MKIKIPYSDFKMKMEITPDGTTIEISDDLSVRVETQSAVYGLDVFPDGRIELDQLSKKVHGR